MSTDFTDDTEEEKKGIAKKIAARKQSPPIKKH